MGLFMSKDTALARVVEDDRCPVMQRVKALEQMDHPQLKMLRSLIVESKTPRKTEVPPKLKALASMRYVQELHLRHLRKLQRTQAKKYSNNALGI